MHDAYDPVLCSEPHDSLVADAEAKEYIQD
jgi:hypothetical protein